MKYNYKAISIRIAEGIAFVKLNSPVNRKPVSFDMKRELADLLDKVQRDERVRVILVTGHGRVFFVGSDLRLDDYDHEDPWRRTSVRHVDLTTIIRSMTKPIIAVVNGYAIGAGMALALACDMVIATDDALFCEVVRGNPRTGAREGAVYYLPQIYRDKVNASLSAWYTEQVGDPGYISCRITADEAVRAGMISKAVERADLEYEALLLSRSLASGMAVSMAFVRRMQERAIWDFSVDMTNSDGGQRA